MPPLASHILDELERHSEHWHHNYNASMALKACAHVIQDAQNAERLVFMAIGFANLQEEDFIERNSVDLIFQGINTAGGHVAEALMILASNFQVRCAPFPDLLSPTLQLFAGNKHFAIRALILRRLPYFQSKMSALSWKIFHCAMKDGSGLWQFAESWLYYSYHNHFEKVAPLLALIYREGSCKDMETWGRISALSALSNRIDFDAWLNDLKTLDVADAWQGAGSVWTNVENIKQHRKQCLSGIEAGLTATEPHAAIIAQNMEKLFRDNASVISIPTELIRLYFTILGSNNESKLHCFINFGKWLNATSHRDPEQAVAVTEIYLAYVKHIKSYLYDHENNLAQLMTRLFSEAEEREESDHGEMLGRVVSIQDTLLTLELNNINDWLRAAERP